jgi:NitT/TauT family transport system permease protein
MVVIAILIIIWESTAQLLRSPFFPKFSEVIRAFVTIAIIGDVEHFYLSDHIAASVLRVLAGFGAACITGFPLGLAMGLRPLSYDATKSFFEPLRFIPPIAWIPLIVILLTGYSRYVLIIWLGAFFPILLSTVAGVKRASSVLIDVAKTFGADAKSVVFKIVVPSALPEVAAGMRIGLGVGWMCIVAAEMIGGETVGLGRLILRYAQLLRVDVVIAGMITIGLLGLIMNEMFLQAEKHLFRWRREIRV